MNEDLAAVLDLLRSISECFWEKKGWLYHKANDGQWVEVSEDLHDLLTEARETLESYEGDT